MAPGGRAPSPVTRRPLAAGGGRGGQPVSRVVAGFARRCRRAGFIRRVTLGLLLRRGWWQRARAAGGPGDGWALGARRPSSHGQVVPGARSVCALGSFGVDTRHYGAVFLCPPVPAHPSTTGPVGQRMKAQKM